MRITWLGHATVLLELDGARLLTDPLLRGRVAHLRRRVAEPRDPRPVHGVLVSHVHYDHLDRPSLRAVASPATSAVVPAGAGPLLGGLGFAAVEEVSAGDVVRVGGASVRAVPALHEARRLPWRPVRESVGFVMDGVWFAGDTDLHPGMEALRGGVDVALVPVWGWGPSLGPGHLDPERAARALAIVRPRLAVPIHWGTYSPIGRDAAAPGEPAVRFADRARKLAPATRVHVLAPGESLVA